jgi:hypothetical protein
MAVYNSKVTDVFSKGGRIRTLNHRGSLLSSFAEVTPYNVSGGAQLAVGDILTLFPIPYRCMIRGIYVASLNAVNANFRAKLNLYGLKRDGKTLDNLIKEDVDGGLVGGTAMPVAANLTLRTNASVARYTLFQSLSAAPEGSPWKPIDAFVPYKEDRLGVLALTVSAVANADLTADARIAVRADFIEAAPSDGPFVNVIGLTSQTV